ncbi:myTH4 domain protein [Dictyocaulus viviparus]|uniref:MyTH4 domain protein n=1 Tax=Dictyocaulus viviparus TaxID=29172 RepID=A0A0D8Y9J7_DICVI|nr:myTH4 domain protein [Dictyocaulus viviparus]
MRRPELAAYSSASSIERSSSSLHSLNNLAENIPMSAIEKLYFIIGIGILKEELRDEIYCQLCKQLSSNPSNLSDARGWMLLSLCVRCFTPSPRFIKYLYCFIQQRSSTHPKCSSYMKECLRRTEQNGCRRQPPSYIELQISEVFFVK